MCWAQNRSHRHLQSRSSTPAVLRSTFRSRLQPNFNSLRTGRPLLVVLLLCIVVLVGCADEAGIDEDRRFANDPVTHAPSEPSSEVIPDGEPATREAPTATSPDAAVGLLVSESAPVAVVLRLENALKVVDSRDPENPTLIEFAKDMSILDFVVSPSGGRVAVLLQNDASFPPALAVELRNTRGELLTEWDISQWSSPPTNPADGAPLSAGHSISWTGESERILVTLGGATLVNIPLDGTPAEIPIPESLQHVITADWSPTADVIAILGISSKGTGTIWTLNPYIDGDSLKQVMPPPADAASLGNVSQFSWLPDGTGLLYILAPSGASTNPGGNLYRLNLQSRDRSIVSTPGRGGPSAQIVDFVVSPDGGSVAYVIDSQSGDKWLYHSLWIRSLESAVYTPVHTGQVSSVTSMGWLGSGFTWQVPETTGPELWFESPEVEPIIVSSSTVTAEEATPMTSTPVATPIDTADATMVGTPVATPVGSPVPILIGSPVATPPIVTLAATPN